MLKNLHSVVLLETLQLQVFQNFWALLCVQMGSSIVFYYGFITPWTKTNYKQKVSFIFVVFKFVCLFILLSRLFLFSFCWIKVIWLGTYYLYNRHRTSDTSINIYLRIDSPSPILFAYCLEVEDPEWYVIPDTLKRVSTPLVTGAIQSEYIVMSTTKSKRLKQKNNYPIWKAKKNYNITWRMRRFANHNHQLFSGTQWKQFRSS